MCAVIFPYLLVFFKKKYKRNLITGLREQNHRSPPKVPNNSKGYMPGEISIGPGIKAQIQVGKSAPPCGGMHNLHHVDSHQYVVWHSENF